MIRKTAIVINDFSGGQDTKTPNISLPANKSPNMRNFHCAGIPSRLMKRDGFTKLNSTAIPASGLDVAYPPGYQTYDYAHRDTATHTKIGQGFKMKTSGTVTKVRLWLKKTSAPAGDITLEIQTDDSGVPSGTAITNGTSVVVAAAGLATTYGWSTFTFTTNPTVVAGTQYHLVISSDVAISNTDYVSWGADDYDVLYPDGSMSYNDGTTWIADSNYDAVFEVYTTAGALGDDMYALWDYNSKHMLVGICGNSVYKMDKNSSGTPDGTWDALGGGTAWDAYVKLILHFDGADGSKANYTSEDNDARTISLGTATGTDTQLDTAQKKFGTASLLFDGTDDYATVPDSNDWYYASEPFTIDFWVRFAALSNANLYRQLSGATYVSIAYNNLTHTITFDAIDGGASNLEFTFPFSPNINTWYHIAVVRVNTDNAATGWRGFIDGVSGVLTKVSGNWSDACPNISAVINLGGQGASFLNGWMEEIRISKGIARWTADFTPPTAAYSKATFDISFNRYLTFADWKSGRMLMNTDVGLYTYTGTGSIATVAAAPIGKFLTIFKNYAFIAGVANYPDQLRYSALNDYTTWDSANSITINTNDGDVITGVRELRGRLYIFKRYSIHRLSYLGSNPTFQADQVASMGTPSHYSIKEVDMGGDVGSVLIFLTTDKKLAAFNGYDLEYINDTLTEKTNELFATADDQPLALSQLNMTYSDLFHAQVNKSNNEYILYCVLNSDTSVNYAFVFDYKTGGVFPYDNQPFASSSMVVSTNRVKMLYTSGYTGYTWTNESGTSDDGTAVRAYWVSSKFRPENLGLMSKALLLGIRIKEISSSSTLNLGFQFRLDQNVSWTTSQSFAYNRADEYEFGKIVMFDIGTIHNMFQVKLVHATDSAVPTIYGIELYGDALGINVKDRATS